MDGWDLESYRRRLSAFGWKTFIIDGHSLPEIIDAYGGAMSSRERPSMLIAKTVKGKGVSFLEDKNGWHGKSVEKEEAGRAIAELGSVDRALRGTIASPKSARGAPPPPLAKPADDPSYPPEQLVATRKAYGNAITRIYPSIPAIVALDGEVGNSTYAELFQKAFPDRFFEMYIAEQNMAGTAVGLARRGKIPFVSTFAAFLTRAFDQIRMAAYSDANVKFVGSHAGVSIGEDGPSQMGLEDIAMFRSILGSVVLYPSDAFCAERLVEEAARHRGIVYIRTTRSPTPLLYSARDSFRIGGSSVLRENGADRATVIAAGITVHEALVAYEELKTEGILIRVVDCYSIKPLDEATLHKAIRETGACITVEDHYQAGGLGEAILASLSHVGFPARLLAVRKKPKSGKTRELLDYEEISRHAIIKAVKEIV
jgi:transketolase